MEKCSKILRTQLLRTVVHIKMSSKETDHLTRTQGITRREVFTNATVKEIRRESETVKSLLLKVHNKDFSFKPGQWVDTFIPGVETVGGFSVCTSPGLLRTQGVLMVAVKFSSHPPAFWIHTSCKVGDQLLLRVGGNFYFDPSPDDSTNLLLIAGGVGINPLYSIINHVVDLNQTLENHYNGKVLLLYSAKTSSELLFQSHLQQVCGLWHNIKADFFVTRQSTVKSPFKASRIQGDDINRAYQQLSLESLKVYICGPLPMISDMEAYCFAQGIRKDQVLYEKWW